MAQKHIAIGKDSNPAYFSIIDEHNSIVKEYDRINSLLTSYRVPRLFLAGQGRKIRSIGMQLKELQDRFLKWDNRIHDFTVHPNITIPPEADGDTSFSHYMNVLRDVRQLTNSRFGTIVGNYNRVYEGYLSQVNFLIAIISCTASLVGLIFAIIAFG